MVAGPRRAESPASPDRVARDLRRTSETSRELAFLDQPQ